MKKWECIVCGLIYDEEEGWPEDGIEPGTKWEDVPEDWVCPDCGVGKEDFEMVEIDRFKILDRPFKVMLLFDAIIIKYNSKYTTSLLSMH